MVVETAAALVVIVVSFAAVSDPSLVAEEEHPLDEAEQMLLHPFAWEEVAGVVGHLGVAAAEMHSSCCDLR